MKKLSEEDRTRIVFNLKRATKDCLITNGFWYSLNYYNMTKMLKVQYPEFEAFIIKEGYKSNQDVADRMPYNPDIFRRLFDEMVKMADEHGTRCIILGTASMHSSAEPTKLKLGNELYQLFPTVFKIRICGYSHFVVNAWSTKRFNQKKSTKKIIAMVDEHFPKYEPQNILFYNSPIEPVVKNGRLKFYFLRKERIT